MAAYYNEFDPRAAAWLRELIRRGLIADGEVDERSIVDVAANDLRGFTQCHFFAGIGGWSHALRLAGWSDDRPVWTGSPPCQPFSAAGQQKGKDDERHLAPHFAELVTAGRPAVLFGEQVASAAVFGKAAKRAGDAVDGKPEWAWIDDLFNRLEAAHYACGASDIPAAGIGAPHIRQRTFFGAVRLVYPDCARQQAERFGSVWDGQQLEAGFRGATERLADADDTGPQGRFGMPERADQCAVGSRGVAGGLADADSGQRGRVADGEGCQPDRTTPRWQQSDGEPERGCDTLLPSAVHSPWSTSDWLFCRDGKWRPVGPGTFPLAHGVPARVGRLRGYGNAIVPQVAAQFVRAFDQALRD